MSEPTADPIERYAALKRQIAALETELDALKDDVFKAVDEKGGEAAGENFVIKSSKRAKYRFSEDYENRNKEVKALRKAEIDSGAATVESFTEYVTIRFKD